MFLGADTNGVAEWALSRRPFPGAGGVGTQEDESEEREARVER